MPSEGSNLRPTIQTPEGFLAECQRRGIKLTIEGEKIRATGKPPAKPEAFAAFLRSRKSELLALLRPSEEPQQAAASPLPLAAVEPLQEQEVRQSARQKLLEWALSESSRGLLPELAEPLTLPSGNVVQAGGAAAWLIAAESRRVGLADHAAAWPDCALALHIVERDMVALASWTAVSARNEGRKLEN
ncbi:hypothetical protein [Armatimonas sp.]|uniref:hypothetical protein n=1 Tax=Armatimonas sp. TaxID=1872638 RepID=UPI00286B2DE8|nr:hypothetical protein [Armatimonas sp.]